MQEFVRQAKERGAAGVLQYNPLSVKSSPLSAKRRAQGQLLQQRANINLRPFLYKITMKFYQISFYKGERCTNVLVCTACVQGICGLYINLINCSLKHTHAAVNCSVIQSQHLGFITPKVFFFFFSHPTCSVRYELLAGAISKLHDDHIITISI